MKQIWSDHVLEFLQGHPLFVFASFTQDQILTVLDRYAVEDIFVGKTQKLHDAQDCQNGFYLLVRGKLDVSEKGLLQGNPSFTHFVNKNAVYARLLYPGAVIGVSTFLTSEDRRWQYNIYAGDVTELLYFPRETFLQRMLQTDKCDSLDIRFWQQLFRWQADETQEIKKHLSFLQLKGIRTKLVAFLLDRAEICGSSHFTLPYSREDLARYLNITRPSMSRELALLKQEGWLDFSLRSFQLLNLSAMRAFLNEHFR